MAVIREINPGLPIGLDCIDDRGLKPCDEVQNVKTPAGVYGVAQDLYVARYVKYPQEYGSWRTTPLGESAKIIAACLGEKAIAAYTHEQCAAELGVFPIAETIINRPGEVLALARQVHGGDITEEQYGGVADAYRYMLGGTGANVFRGAPLEARCMDTANSQYPAVVRKRLVYPDHSATTLQINHRRDTWFDASRAYTTKPSYHADQWVVPRIAEIVDDMLPHDNIDGFVVAASIRTAAVALNLPYGGDVSRLGLDIHTIAA